jgi:hypothetical protein
MADTALDPHHGIERILGRSLECMNTRGTV